MPGGNQRLPSAAKGATLDWAQQIERVANQNFTILATGKQDSNAQLQPVTKPKATLPVPERDGLIIYVPDNTSGPCLGVSLSGAWRMVLLGAVIS